MENGGQRKLDRARRQRWALVLVCASTLFCVFFFMLRPVQVSAVTTVPTKMNFQGRLTNSAGNIMPDGTYNMTFRIYDASTAGNLEWSEVRAVSAGTGVPVENGLFSVRLGDVTSLPASLFTNTSLYFEIELPTPATATCSTGGCASYTEGPMTPRNQLSSSAYAFNSDTLDGYDSAAFAFVDGSNTFTAAQTINVASSTALDVQDGSGISLLKVDTSAGKVVVGDSSNGIAMTSSGIVFSGTARPSKTITLAPEYPGATFTGSGIGSLSSDFCSGDLLLNVNTTVCSFTDEHNYYAWTTTEASAQTYSVYVRHRIPSDYAFGSMANLRIWGWGTTSASEVVGLELYKGSDTACGSLTNAVTANATWSEGVIASPLGSCPVSPGDMVTLKVTMTAGTNNTALAGEISFDYRSAF